MAPLPLTLACGPYDRTRALADGRVPVEGVDLRYVPLDPEEIFFRMLGHGPGRAEFDVSELSLSSYLLTHLAAGTAGTASPLVAIPVFPSRSFRHSGVYVSEKSGLTRPEDLPGATVGVAEYQLTANVWIRGILQEYHGVPARSVRYRTGGLNEPGREEKVRLDLPPDIDVAPIPPGQTLAGLLARGEIDAIYSPRAPEGAGIRRLFADPRGAEQEYYRASGIFPVMHVVVIQRRLYEANRWLAASLTKAFSQSKALAYADLQRTAALAVTLPWVREEYQATVELLGEDYWSYGLDANRPVLETFIRYAGEQGMITRQPAPDELFAPETLRSVII